MEKTQISKGSLKILMDNLDKMGNRSKESIQDSLERSSKQIEGYREAIKEAQDEIRTCRAILAAIGEANAAMGGEDDD